RSIMAAPIAQNLSYRANRSGGADCAVPPERLESDFDGLELQARGEPRSFHALLRDRPVAEEARAHADASHVEAFQLLCLQPLPHDQLGTPSPDVHDEAPPGLARRGMRNAEIHEPRFF